MICTIVFSAFFLYRGNALMTLFLILLFFLIQEDFEFKDEKMLINNFSVNSMKNYLLKDKIRLIVIISIITCALPLIFDKLPIFPEYYYLVIIGISFYINFGKRKI